MKNILEKLPDLESSIQAAITNTYEYYISKISLKGHAASLELGLLLYKLCVQLSPNSIVDLGSGFTSYVFRLYQQKNPSILVYSVDDDSAWLEKTRNFLTSQNLNTTNLILWEQFQTLLNKFDLVLYDLGRIPTRILNIDKPFNFLNPNGLLILDDAHFDEQFSTKLKIPGPFLSDVMDEALQRLQYQSHNLKSQTVDCFGRYALAAWK